MPAYEPAAYLKFAAEQVALLRAVYYRSDGLAESELRQLITRLRKPDQPSSGYIFRQLREMDMVEEMPGQTAFFELTAPWKEMLGHLFREQRLTNVAVIQTYLTELERLDTELSGSVRENAGSQCVILLQEIRSMVERMRRDSHDNRLGIISEALRFKSGEGDIPAIERYERIIRLWEKYVEPLRDIIDSRKEMDERFPDFDAAIYYAGRMSERLLQWLEAQSFDVVHFGDYDPAGLQEYIILKKCCNCRATLYIPESLSELIQRYGKQELIRDSSEIFAGLRKSNDETVIKVLSCLEDFGLGLEQEILWANLEGE